MTLDVARIRKDFPILDRQVRDGQPLVYLDSANTSQKPRQVIERLDEFYERHNANIHRASHQLGEEATAAYEGARIKAAGFIGARDETEVVFTKNISEGINLVAYAMGNATAGQPASGLTSAQYCRATTLPGSARSRSVISRVKRSKRARLRVEVCSSTKNAKLSRICANRSAMCSASAFSLGLKTSRMRVPSSDAAENPPPAAAMVR